MPKQLTVNRYLKDKHFDRIDHALGRPVDPMGDTYRDYFAVDSDSDIAAMFRATTHWKEGKTFGKMTWFHVTQEGRAALRDHLIEIGNKHRLYIVTWDGFEMPQVATSHSKARYAKWCSISDSYEIPFGEFAAQAKVRLA